MANVSGGGIYVTYARKTNFFMYNSNITGNVASSKGGGIVIDTSNFKSDSNDEVPTRKLYPGKDNRHNN